MDPAVIGSRLASSAVAPLIRKLFVSEASGAGLVDKPVRISGLVSFRGEKRTLTEKDIRKLSTELVSRAIETAGPHERPIPAEEDQAVADAVARTLLALGELDMDDVQAVSLGHRALVRRLLDLALDQGLTLTLGWDATELYRSLLETTCLHVLHFFTQRSDFVARTLVEQSRQLSDLITRIDLLVTRNPAASTLDARFEQRYADYISQKYGTLTIVGLDLSHAEATWPLDAAYLSLETVASEECASSLTDPQPLGPVPADQALAGQAKVLLRGVAGSGKTTLVQWLAVCAARQRLPEGMEHLRGVIPFVLPLRTIARQPALPLPDGFLAAVQNPLHSAQPQGWADRLLSARRGLLLIDGIDEIPERDRERVRAWLADLIVAYPGNLWLVTSRPSAVADSWLADQGFTELLLSSMSREDIAAFVGRWHEAARTTCRTEEERADLDGYQGALHDAIRGKQDLARLATNPLMCGLICALHRARRGYLPPDRKELYDAALSMLLSRRDMERHVYAPGDVQLAERPQIQLLQRLAYWLIRNGQTELDRDRAEHIIAEALPAVPDAQRQGDAGQILRHLLLRSGILREPAAGAVDFVHRTFQDYLGAKAAVEAWDIGLLVKNADDSQWEDVIRMAVAHSSPRECAELLTRLLARGAEEPDVQARLHLLATACLEHVPDLDPAIRDQVKRHADKLIPPASAAQAGALSAVGPLLLELLPPPDGLTSTQANLCVMAASHIASDAAIGYLRRFVPANPTTRRALMNAWARYDTERYFTDVISQLPREETFIANTEEQLRRLHHAGGRAQMRVNGNHSGRLLEELLNPAELTLLSLRDNNALTDFGFLRGFGQLRDLSFSRCRRISDLSALSDLALHTLFLARERGRSLPVGLGSLTTLKHLRLYLGSDPRIFDVRLPSLTRLTLTADESGFDLNQVVQAFPGLEAVRIETARTAGEPLDLAPLGELAHLSHVQVYGPDTRGADRLEGRSVRLHGIPRPRTRIS
ncbi:NACHT domain-containing protein [Streptomyces sp. AK02-01A]|uniref:NACHT domain-containing protein n=1 Tax=Streptomyces sp. AK02-01A TaxID=3028648 RepID=UPI0029A6A3F3|nr:NACHT domain-containing protein [Streptomyces sp. AK02-01A]MDX3855205.1 NACHT domain-containing protein [Streptomyces sp. AK02-01A]